MVNKQEVVPRPSPLTHFHEYQKSRSMLGQTLKQEKVFHVSGII